MATTLPHHVTLILKDLHQSAGLPKGLVQNLKSLHLTLPKLKPIFEAPKKQQTTAQNRILLHRILTKLNKKKKKKNKNKKLKNGNSLADASAGEIIIEIVHELEDLLDGKFDELVSLSQSRGGSRFGRQMMKCGYWVKRGLIRRSLALTLRSVDKGLRSIVGPPTVAEMSPGPPPELPRAPTNLRDDNPSRKQPQQLPIIPRSLDEEFDRVKSQLLEANESGKSVIAITGVGGTILAERLYNAKDVNSCFDCKAWLTVSWSNIVIHLLRQLMVHVTKLSDNVTAGMDKEELIEKLRNYLHSRRYLIVLDDIWELEVWNSVKVAFPDDGIGSKVILTTSNLDVAMYELGAHVVKLHAEEPGARADQAIDEKEALDLFRSHAFRDGRFPELLDIDLPKKIVQASKREPVVIKAVAGILKYKGLDYDSWRDTFMSLPNNDADNIDDLSALSLCFDQMDDCLKQFFCYLTAIPRKNPPPIDILDILTSSVVEGVVKTEGKKYLEEIANELLEELIKRFMVDKVESAQHGQEVVIHDPLRKLGQAKQKDQYEFQIPDSLKTGNYSVRLSERSTDKLIFSWRADNLHILKQLKLENSENVEVIDLQGIRLKSLPEKIGNLRKLRYLNLRNSFITELPSTIGNLSNLKMLDIRGTRITEVDDSFWDIKPLKHLFFPVHFFQSEPTLKNKMENLETLVGIQSGDWVVKGLREGMEKIKTLAMANVSDSHDIEIGTAIEHACSHISCLRLEGDSLPTRVFTLTHSSLEQIYFSGPLGRHHLHVSDNQEALPNLTKLFFINSNLVQDDVKKLSKLPKLAHLVLWNSYLGKVLEFDAGWFPRLQTLELLSMGELETLEVHANSLSSLDNLCISNCRLTKFPEGLKQLKKLRVFAVKHVPTIKEKTEEWEAESRENSELQVTYVG